MAPSAKLATSHWEIALGELMNALTTKFGVNAAALAVAAAATVIPLQAAAQAAPVSSYASEWTQSVSTAFSDVPLAPFCFGTVQTCVSPDATVLFSLNLASILRLVPLVGPFIAAVISQFNIAGCFFGICLQAGPYGTISGSAGS